MGNLTIMYPKRCSIYLRGTILDEKTNHVMEEGLTCVTWVSPCPSCFLAAVQDLDS